jgi:membrane protease YdiL (CAAX protease family)
MQLPGTPSLFLLFFLFVVMPWLAIKSSRRLRELSSVNSGATGISRNRIWYSTLFVQGLLFALASIVGNGFGFRIFAMPKPTSSAVITAGLSLGVLFVIRDVLRRTRTAEERSQLLVYFLAPRSQREWQLTLLTIAAASIAEEAAWRGVAMSIMLYSTGSVVLSLIMCSLTFALAHWVQGLKSLIAIFAIAVTMHGLVMWTETLVYAMVVHAVYDLVAMVLIAGEARQPGIIAGKSVIKVD